ncbi:CHASE2 domain-containing sensor protein/signal transduction histidine kinase [Variovorax boronicumulans]|uniref:CHASE2 domain-containing protein n=1 Tax=Variovorax boronicumulans TaxID=436515 RepID=UPI002477292B|nr:CHASE2 domain-containing protein [Variovorax boronicumulans]MDH6166488.1 CHASE2 domain-containing sensor protein/signal transduction histidine kinase [Variovorax boronicumulans]
MSWLMLVAAALAVVVGLDDSYTLRQSNRFLQDALIALQGRELRQAHDSQVVIVEIDDKSLEALGPWPWRKTAHARLIDRVMQDAPLAIGLDILLTDPDAQEPGDNKVLANALERSGKVVLTAMLQSDGGNPLTIEPIGCLAQAAARVGLDRLPVDEDGVSRDVYLHEGLAGFEFDHFSLAMLKVVNPHHEFEKMPPGRLEAEELPHTPPSGRWVDWRRSHRMIVPFAGPPGRFRRISYIDVLTDSVPPGTFRGKYVLVGTTAPALGNLYATPVSAKGNLMPGVEINANVLDSLLRRHDLSPAPAWLNMALSLSAVLLALVGMAFLEPLAALLLTGALALLLPLATVLGNVLFQLQFAPAAGVLGLGVTYALWSWSQLNSATRYLIDASRHLRANVDLAQTPTDDKHPSGDFLDRRIKALIKATEHLHDLHQFVSDSLDNLPDVTLVCDRHGRIRLANAAAARYFNATAGTALSNASAVALMRRIHSPGDQRPVITSNALTGPPAASVVSARDEHAHDLLVRRVPSLSAKGQHTGWILSLVDVTELHQIQRQRDSALHFLSHDIRAPQTAILTLLTLRKHSPEAMTQVQLEERIERHARKALSLSDGFIQLMRAQSQRYRFEPCDLSELLLECIDDAWEACERKQIKVTMFRSSQEPLSRVDRDLVSRAIGNLLGNALKHAPSHSTITCAVEVHGGDWAILVQDQGPGIARERQAEVFEPFSRTSSSVRTDGAGLGLAFVKTVASRHGGKIILESAPGHGCSFRLVLPRTTLAPARSLQD